MTPPPPGMRNPGMDHEDPTGVRALLGSLPDPGPMPADVVQRIESSLSAAAESVPRAGASGGSDRTWGSTRPNLPGGASPRTIAALAAGFLMIAGTGVFGLRSLQTDGTPGPPMAIAPASHPSSTSPDRHPSPTSPPTGPASHTSPTGPTTGPHNPFTPTPTSPPAVSGGTDGTPKDQPAETIFVASGTIYLPDTMAAQATQLWRDPGAPLPALAAEQPGIGPLATPAALSECLDALDVASAPRAVVDFALYRQRPAAVIITGDAHAAQVRVVDRSCRAGHPNLLLGPVSLTKL